MLVGRPPFKAGTEYLTFQLIAAGQVDMPASLPPHAQDLLRRLLVPEARQRLGQLLGCLSDAPHCFVIVHALQYVAITLFLISNNAGPVAC